MKPRAPQPEAGRVGQGNGPRNECVLARPNSHRTPHVSCTCFLQGLDAGGHIIRGVQRMSVND